MPHDRRIAWRAAFGAVAALIVASPGFGQSPSPFQSVPAPSAPAPAPTAKPRPSHPQASEPDAAPAAPDDNVSAAEADDRGNRAYLRDNYAEAMRWYRKGADLGNPHAMGSLADMYSAGFLKAVPTDYAEAVRLYRKAADLGYDAAMFKLGWACRFGKGEPQDYAQAILWYRRAAAVANGTFDHKDAYFSIAEMYAIGGPNLPQDMTQARYWYQLAAQAGDDSAKDWLAKH